MYNDAVLINNKTQKLIDFHIDEYISEKSTFDEIATAEVLLNYKLTSLYVKLGKLPVSAYWTEKIVVRSIVLTHSDGFITEWFIPREITEAELKDWVNSKSEEENSDDNWDD
jgi:hypothetical protein